MKAPDLYTTRDPEKSVGATATTRGAILTVAAALIAATAAGAGVYVTARTIRTNQQVLAETERANREADQRDRYATAIEQLGSDKTDVRLGGIYGLERIAKTSEQDHLAVVEVLNAFVRGHTDPCYLYEQAGMPGFEGVSWEDRRAYTVRTYCSLWPMHMLPGLNTPQSMSRPLSPCSADFLPDTGYPEGTWPAPCSSGRIWLALTSVERIWPALTSPERTWPMPGSMGRNWMMSGSTGQICPW